MYVGVWLKWKHFDEYIGIFGLTTEAHILVSIINLNWHKYTYK